MNKVIVITVVALIATTGCGGALHVANDGATLTGSPEGIRAMMDGFGGLITDGKASPDQDTAHWIARKDQEKEITKRSLAPGFLAGLFKGGN